MNKFLAISVLLVLSLSQLNAYDYNQNGADWCSVSSDCCLPNQSPIDLKSSLSGDTIDTSFDRVNKMYTNQVSSIAITWTGKTSQVAVNKASQDTQYFTSKFASARYGAADRFNGQQFHFHAGSEHTIDGKRHDLEMHTVHVADTTLSGVSHAALGIMFSVSDHNADISEADQAIINRFFDNLKWSQTASDPSVDLVSYGDLMMMVDFNDRWVYKGSVTTPPCARFVYWNVLRTIYPLRQSDLDKFKNQLNRQAGLAALGNYREIQKYDDHDLHIIKPRRDNRIIWLSVFVGIFGVASLALGFLLIRQMRRSSAVVKMMP